MTTPSPRRISSTRRTTAGLANAVFASGGAVEHARARVVIAFVLALLAHAGGWQWARRNDAAAGAGPPRSPDTEVELEPPPPPAPPPPAPEPPPAEPRVARAPSPAPRAARAIQPPSSPAQAAAIVAQDTPPDTAAEFDAFVTGSARAYAGGLTATSGQSTRAVTSTPVASSNAKAVATSTPVLSSAVSLADDEWQCPWPHEADAEDIDEAAVVLRALVRADGSVASARILADPGHGFGRAALACAMRTRFTAGRDLRGTPTTAQSPPIRVRFTR